MAAAESLQLLTDIRLALRHKELRPVYEVAGVRRRVSTRQGLLTILDLETVSGQDNLAQAIVVRLLTPRGELAALGHPEYGSRLHELIGRQNTETTRNLARLFILESLQQEPRIAKIVELVVAPSPGSRDRVDVRLRVQPVGATETVTVGPFTLELEQ
jgi:phage baseplate assembly protein W